MEIFLCNGFACDVLAVLTPSTVDADACFGHGRHLWDGVSVGNVVPVRLSTADSVELFSVNNMVSRVDLCKRNVYISQFIIGLTDDLTRSWDERSAE